MSTDAVIEEKITPELSSNTPHKGHVLTGSIFSDNFRIFFAPFANWWQNISVVIIHIKTPVQSASSV